MRAPASRAKRYCPVSCEGREKKGAGTARSTTRAWLRKAGHDVHPLRSGCPELFKNLQGERYKAGLPEAPQRLALKRWGSLRETQPTVKRRPAQPFTPRTPWPART